MAGLTHDPFADWRDETDLFSNRDEFLRPNEPARWVSSADERFSSGDLFCFQINLRLVVHFELTKKERLPKLQFEDAPAVRRGRHVGFEKDKIAAPSRFGAVQCEISARQKHFWV